MYVIFYFLFHFISLIFTLSRKGHQYTANPASTHPQVSQVPTRCPCENPPGKTTDLLLVAM